MTYIAIVLYFLGTLITHAWSKDAMEVSHRFKEEVQESEGLYWSLIFLWPISALTYGGFVLLSLFPKGGTSKDD